MMASKTLGLHLRAACRGVVLLIFGSIYFRSYVVVYTDQSHPSNIIIYYLYSSKPIAMKVGLLLKYVLISEVFVISIIDPPSGGSMRVA